MTKWIVGGLQLDHIGLRVKCSCGYNVQLLVVRQLPELFEFGAATFELEEHIDIFSQIGDSLLIQAFQ